MTYLVHFGFIILKKSAAIVNMRYKLDKERGEAIVKACNLILAGGYWMHFPLKLW